MSYVVLARKYRPRRFEQMVGQDHVVRALTHALEQGRLHHAYLFTGTRGIGKTTVSRILAKSLNCTGADGQGGVTSKPCGVCTACTEIDADRYIDYVELDAASNRSIDEIRDLIERAAYKPSVGRYKVFMIDEAHQLTKDAFNALLKTLEEPPEYLKFVLATTDPEKMLPTVLSRCLQFNLRPMAPETVASHLEQVLGAEGIVHDAGSLRLLSRGARGSMRDALSLTDQAIAYGAGSLEESAVRAMLGTVDRSHANRIVESLGRRDAAAMLAEVNALRGLGLSAAGTLEEVARLLQQMAVEQALPGALDASDSDTEAARTLAAAMPADETQLLYSIAVHGRAELSLAPDEYAGLVMVLLRFMAFPASGPDGGGGGAAPPTGMRRCAASAQAALAAPLPAPTSALVAMAERPRLCPTARRRSLRLWPLRAPPRRRAPAPAATANAAIATAERAVGRACRRQRLARSASRARAGRIAGNRAPTPAAPLLRPTAPRASRGRDRRHGGRLGRAAVGRRRAGHHRRRPARADAEPAQRVSGPRRRVAAGSHGERDARARPFASHGDRSTTMSTPRRRRAAIQQAVAMPPGVARFRTHRARHALVPADRPMRTGRQPDRDGARAGHAVRTGRVRDRRRWQGALALACRPRDLAQSGARREAGRDPARPGRRRPATGRRDR